LHGLKKQCETAGILVVKHNLIFFIFITYNPKADLLQWFILASVMEVYMERENVEIIYEWLDQTVKIIEESYGKTYLEGISVAVNLLVDPAYLDKINQTAKTKLLSRNSPDIESFSKEDLRKAFQLVVLKGMKNHTQANHLMT